MKHAREMESLTVAVTNILSGVYRNLARDKIPKAARSPYLYSMHAAKTQYDREKIEFARRMAIISLGIRTPVRKDDVC